MRASRRRLCAAALLAFAGMPCWSAVPSLAPAASGAGSDERRAALVIGNSSYRVGALKNPVNDAQAVAASLRTLGFDAFVTNVFENRNGRWLIVSHQATPIFREPR